MYIFSVEMCIFRLKTRFIPYVNPPLAMTQSARQAVSTCLTYSIRHAIHKSPPHDITSGSGDPFIFIKVVT